MKMQNRGFGKGHWNFPGGKIEQAETPIRCAIRETLEETGVKVSGLTDPCIFKFYVEGRGLDFIVHMFSPKAFSGTPKSTSEGEVKWVKTDKIPFHQMWDRDKYWVPLILQGLRFDAKFYYDRNNRKTIKYEIILRR